MVYYRHGSELAPRREEQGWVFAHMGPVVFGLYSHQPTTWEPGSSVKDMEHRLDIRWCDSRRNAWVLETARADRYPGTPDEQLEAFAHEVLRAGRLHTGGMDHRQPEFSYDSIHGDTLRMKFAPFQTSVVGKHFINDKPVAYDDWENLDSPWAEQAFDSPIVCVDYGGVRLIYDFEKWTIQGNRLEPVALGTPGGPTPSR